MKGRKKITYSAEDLEREPMIMVVIGETGVGKTHINRQLIDIYLKDDPQTGKKGRKVIAFDTNGHDYANYLTADPKYIKSLTKIAPRRIIPFNDDGTPMDDDQKKDIVGLLTSQYRNGLIVLDDMDHYMAGAKGQSMIGALCTVRHRGIDILLTHQSIAKITTTEWQNCSWLRLHHQVDDPARYKNRIPNYELVKIAQFIVNEQYELAVKAFAKGTITKQEYIQQKSFYVYVDMRGKEILRADKNAFIRACKKFIDQEKSMELKKMMNERDFESGNPVYQNRNDAVIKLIKEYLKFYRG